VGKSGLGEGGIPVERSGSGLSAGLIGEFHELLGLGLKIFGLIVRLSVGRKRGRGEHERHNQNGRQKAHT
jgi:hypothetical protein